MNATEHPSMEVLTDITSPTPTLTSLAASRVLWLAQQMETQSQSVHVLVSNGCCYVYSMYSCGKTCFFDMSYTVLESAIRIH